MSEKNEKKEIKGAYFVSKKSPFIVGLIYLVTAILAFWSGYCLFDGKDIILGIVLLVLIANVTFWFVIYSRTWYEAYEDKIRVRNPLSHRDIKYIEMSSVEAARRGFTLYSTDFRRGLLIRYKNKKGKEKKIFLTPQNFIVLGRVVYAKTHDGKEKTVQEIISTTKKRGQDDVIDDKTEGKTTETTDVKSRE